LSSSGQTEVTAYEVTENTILKEINIHLTVSQPERITARDGIFKVTKR
jgi:hypothetical protein